MRRIDIAARLRRLLGLKVRVDQEGAGARMIYVLSPTDVILGSFEAVKDREIVRCPLGRAWGCFVDGELRSRMMQEGIYVVWEDERKF